MDADYADVIVLLANTPTQAKSQLHSLEQTGDVGHNENDDKTEYMRFNPKGVISTLNGGSLKLEDNFAYLGSSVSFTESYPNMCLTKAWSSFG